MWGFIVGCRLGLFPSGFATCRGLPWVFHVYLSRTPGSAEAGALFIIVPVISVCLQCRHVELELVAMVYDIVTWLLP